MKPWAIIHCPLETDSREIQGLYQPAQDQPLSIPPHQGHRALRGTDRDPDPDRRDAPGGRGGHRLPLAVQGRAKPAMKPTPRNSPGSGSCWNPSKSAGPQEFLESVRIDLFPDEVYVFTPRGDVKTLPKGATPIDFAYAIHTDVGHRCTGARVNNKMVPLRTSCTTATWWRSSPPPTM